MVKEEGKRGEEGKTSDMEVYREGERKIERG